MKTTIRSKGLVREGDTVLGEYSALYEAIRAVGRLRKAMEKDAPRLKPHYRAEAYKLIEYVSVAYKMLAQVADAFGRDRRQNENP